MRIGGFLGEGKGFIEPHRIAVLCDNCNIGVMRSDPELPEFEDVAVE